MLFTSSRSVTYVASSDARVSDALYIFSRSSRRSACCKNGTKLGASSVITHGPFSAVAFSSPFARACCAASANADAGSPFTSLFSVNLSTNALVESSTLLENVVDNFASCCLISLNRCFCSSSSATPPSSASRTFLSTTRFRAALNAPYAVALFWIALNALYTAFDCATRDPNATTVGCTSSTAFRSSSVSFTDLRWFTAPHARSSSSPSASSGGTTSSYLIDDEEHDARFVSRSERRSSSDFKRDVIAGRMWSGWMSLKRGRRREPPAVERSGLVRSSVVVVFV
mmetsp:Transcript_16225/g.35179  ORF Transcript_16225/g.35179 Transcript_16225/m.35179 type:complete len:285 (+) Transcript_16225:1327-2181(+)